MSRLLRSLGVPVFAGVIAIGALVAPAFGQDVKPEPVPDCGGPRSSCECLQAACIGQTKKCPTNTLTIQCCCKPIGTTAGVCVCRAPEACVNSSTEQCQE